jgi:hypothetical protein
MDLIRRLVWNSPDVLPGERLQFREPQAKRSRSANGDSSHGLRIPRPLPA